MLNCFKKILPASFQSECTKYTDFPTSFVDNQVSLKNEALQYWKVYFDFTYYLCLLPFRFKFNISTRTYEEREDYFQRAICSVMRVLTGIYYVMKIRQMYLTGNAKENPTVYFDLAYYFCDTLLLSIMFYILGRKSREINEQVYSELQQTYFVELPYNNSMTGYKQARRTANAICILCLFTLVLYFLEVFHEEYWSIQGIWNYYEKDARLVFFRNFDGQLVGENNTVPTFLTVISAVSNFNERLLNAFSDILFTMTVLMFRNLVKHFSASLRDPEVSAYKILGHYTWLRGITDKINSTMGLVIGCFIFGNLPFYVTNAFDIFRCPNVFLKARYIFYCLYFFPSLFLAAKSNKNIDQIKLWIYEERNYTKIEKTRLAVFLHEVSFHTVGLNSSGCLTVNYNMFGSIISIIFTYALLKTQFNK